MNSCKSNNYYKPFDVEKVNEAIRKSGLKKTEFELSIGHATGYLHHCINRGLIRDTDIKVIKALYDVDIEQKEPPKVVTNEVEDTTAEQLTALRRKIGANNVLLKAQGETLDDIAKTLHTIGNLLTQINEKLYKGDK